MVVMGYVCSKYHGHTHYYQATMLVIVLNCLRLLVDVIVAMAMVVMETCVRSMTPIRTTTTANYTLHCYVGNGVL